jgi:hypothetical protein
LVESKIQQKIIKYLSTKMAVATKLTSMQRGWPDLLVVLPGGTVLFLEVKTATGRLSPHQIRIHAELKRNDANVYVVRSIEEVSDLVSKFSAD